ncbi:MAG: hypothetical protein AAF066_11205 [Pseudomonadota bacterium]
MSLPSDIILKSRRGIEYGLIDALRRNPVTIMACDDISSRAIEQIRRLQIALADIADPNRLDSYGDPGVLRSHARKALEFDETVDD